MECSLVTQTKNVGVKQTRASPTLAAILDEIRQEYGLKQNHFNPKGPSPNIFVSKLQWRMKNYYRDLYSSINFATK